MEKRAWIKEKERERRPRHGWITSGRRALTFLLDAQQIKAIWFARVPRLLCPRLPDCRLFFLFALSLSLFSLLLAHRSSFAYDSTVPAVPPSSCSWYTKPRIYVLTRETSFQPFDGFFYIRVCVHTCVYTCWFFERDDWNISENFILSKSIIIFQYLSNNNFFFLDSWQIRDSTSGRTKDILEGVINKNESKIYQLR